MKKRLVCVGLCMAVLLGILSGLGLFGTAAAGAVTDIRQGQNEDKIIPAADNLLASAAMTANSGGFQQSVLTDGRLTKVNDDTAACSAPNNAETGVNWVSFDLGGNYAVSALLLAGYGNPDWGGFGNGVYGFSVYVGEKGFADITDEDTPVYTTGDTVIYGRRIDLTEPVTGRMITFKLTGLPVTLKTNKGQCWISELAAAGEPLAGTPIEITPTKNPEAILSAEDNLLAKAGMSASASEFQQALLTDGLLSQVNTGEQSCAPADVDTGVNWVTFDLGTPHAVTSLLIAGNGNPTWGGGYGTGIYGCSVYIGSKTHRDLAAGDPQKPVFSTERTILYGQRVDLPEPAVGRYVVFRLTGLPLTLKTNRGQCWVSELAAAGEPLQANLVTDITAAAHTGAVISAEDNLLAAAQITASASLTGAETLTNGKLAKVNADTEGVTLSDAETGVNWITFDLGKVSVIRSLLAAGYGNSDWGGGYGNGIYGFSVYVGDKDHTAITAADTPVYTTADCVIYGRRIDLLEESRGRYVVFKLVGLPTTLGSNKGQCWVSELAALGETVTETSFTDPLYGCTLTVHKKSYSDTAFFENVSGLRVTRSTYAGAAGETVCGGWLVVDTDAPYVYIFTLLDKAGSPIAAAAYEDRTITVTIPNLTGHPQGMGQLRRSVVERVVNSRCPQGQLIGEIAGGEDLAFLPLVFDRRAVVYNGVAG